MITPREIKEKALKSWNNQLFLKDWLSGGSLFPMNIPFAKLPSRIILTNFNEIRKWVQKIGDESKEKKGTGFSIEYRETKHRQMGAQSLPKRIFFETPEDYLACIGKIKEFDCFKEKAALILSKFPSLKKWVAAHPLKVFENRDNWPPLLEVCGFLFHNHGTNQYIRELEIPNVHSKFIENHKSILKELLDEILPSDALNKEITGLAEHGFERRFGLKFKETLIRLRILDSRQAMPFGITDLSVPFSDFQNMNLPCRRVFITENEINGLTFPHLHEAIVIFGLGYGVRSLSQVEWLKGKEIYYWGDIDTHGFSILSGLRTSFPYVQSLLMDKKTLLQFRSLWGKEQKEKRFTGQLKYLTKEEEKLFAELKENRLGENIRLEQERIQLSFLKEKLDNLTPHSGFNFS